MATSWRARRPCGAPFGSTREQATKADRDGSGRRAGGPQGGRHGSWDDDEWCCSGFTHPRGYSVLAQSVLASASPQVRNVATMGLWAKLELPEPEP
jgi:hypothetical protein